MNDLPINAEVVEAAGNARWESVGLVAIVMVGIVLILGGIIKIINSMQKNKEDTDTRIESAVYRANGIPVALLDTLPIPVWYKDRFGIMRYINPAYCAKFNIRPVDYIGKRDIEVWPKEVAEQFTKNDNSVLERGVYITVYESVPLDSKDHDSERERFYVQKGPYVHPVSNQIEGTIGTLLDNKHIDRIIQENHGLWEEPHVGTFGETS